MAPVVNPRLDLDRVRQELEDGGVAVVRDFFVKPLAQKTLDALETRTPWDLAYAERGEGKLIPADRLAQLSEAEVRDAVAPAMASAASASFQFVYNTSIVVDPVLAGVFPESYLYQLAAQLNEPAYLDLSRRMTGRANVTRTSVMAARYLPGHFLTLHDDVHETERREVAYILNLTKDWRPEWGGLLHVVAADRRTVLRTITPEFNTMVLLKTPTWHFVSQVASYARAPRYTLTGWMLSS